MKLFLHFVALLFYISTINSSSYNDLEDTVLSLLGDFSEEKHKIKDIVPVKHDKRPTIDDDKKRSFPEQPRDTLVKLRQNSFKVVTAKDSYKDVMLSLNKYDETDKGTKLHKHIKKHVRKPYKETLNELLHSEEPDKITPNAQLVLQQLNNKLDSSTNQNGQYFKKPSKEFLLSQPKENKAVAVKLQYRNNLGPNENRQRDEQDIRDARDKAKIILSAKAHEEQLDDMKLSNRIGYVDAGREHFKIDSVLNVLKHIERRKAKSSSETYEDMDESTDQELGNWQDKFRELYMKKKYEAINATERPGDVVNMVAARPWGVPCGDPNQHDMPWGNCMLAPECDPEFRIYRGDHFCGRTQYVCCGIKVQEYDMYQGFDLSFDDKSLSTDTREKRIKEKDSKDASKKRKERERKKKGRQRQKRKRKIKKRIKNIKKEIEKILDKEYKKGNKLRKKRTKTLQNFIKNMKRQYKKDRESIKDIHEETMITVDANLMKKINDLSAMNKNFIRNDTFREMIVNGTMTKKGARMLVEAYPDMEQYIPKILRRFDLNDNFVDYLEYDLEYGYLYY